MKLLLISLYFILTTVIYTSGQTLSIYGFDTQDYPIVKAKIYLIDDDGSIIPGLTSNKLELTENGLPLDIINFDCPPPKPIEAISAVLTIDISGSMSGGNIENAKYAALAWINALPLGKSECALTGFNHENILLTDFTTDRKKLIDRINQLSPGGGTNFDAGLINPVAGSLLIAENAKYKPVIVFLTDGIASGNEQEIVDLAKKINASIYCITLNNPMPSILKNISEQTGGLWFENITSEEQAKDVYLTILQSAQGSQPCEISWKSTDCPQIGVKNVKYLPLDISTDFNYNVPLGDLPSLNSLNANSLNFGGIKPGETIEKQFYLQAGSKPIKIFDITLDHEEFSINFDGELELNANQEYQLIVRYSPKDSSYKFARININSTACNLRSLYVTGGYAYSSLGENTLKIIRPNGGELYPVKADTTFEWTGLLPEDRISVEVSIDRGKSWTKLTDTATGLISNWIAPENESNDCLMRIRRFETESFKANNLKGHNNDVTSISWSPDGNKIISDSEDRLINIWNVKSGQIIKSFSGPLHYNAVSWSPNDSMIAYSLSDYSIEIIDSKNYNIITELLGHKLWVTSLDWSADSKYLVSGSNDGTLKVWDTQKAKIEEIRSFSLGSEINEVRWSKNSENIVAACEDGKVRVVNTVSGNIASLLATNYGKVIAVSWDPTDNFIAAAYQNGKLVVWDLSNNSIVYTLSGHSGDIHSVDWHPNQPRIASGGFDGSIRIWDFLSGIEILNIPAHNQDVRCVRWEPNGVRLGSSSNDDIIKIWQFTFLFQEDRSDDLWSTKIAHASANDIDFGIKPIGSTTDSVIINYIRNDSPLPLDIKKIFFTGPNNTEFDLVSYLPPYRLESDEKRNLEIRFAAITEGNKNATINIITTNDTLQYNISAIAVNPLMQIQNSFINFGALFIGEKKDTTSIILKNIGQQPVVLNDIQSLGPEVKQFFLLQKFEPITLNPGETLELGFRFQPSDSGRMMNNFGIFYENYGSPAVVTLFGEGIDFCGPYSFIYDNFVTTQRLSLNGNARRQQDSTIRLTSVGTFETGSMWFANKVPVGVGFTSEFTINLANGNNFQSNEESLPGADGFAFVIQNSSPTALGNAGSGIGYGDIPNSLAVEFDTYSNDANQIQNRFDPNGNHVAIMSNGINNNGNFHVDTTEIAINKDILPIIADGRDYFVKIEYIPEENNSFKVYIDTLREFTTPVINTTEVNLVEKLNLSDSVFAFIGITAATGDATEEHIIRNWFVCPNREYKPITSILDFYKYTKSSKELKVYPNPAKDYLKIDFDLVESGASRLEIFDYTGVLIYSQKNNCLAGTNSIELNLKLNTGKYLLRIVSNKQVLTNTINVIK